MIFYSQAGQDEWVVNFFDKKKNGFFLDVGAYDGIDLSNTYFLEKELDWSGICIEANSQKFELLKNNRKCLCLNSLISDKIEKLHFLPDNLSGRISKFSNSTVEIESETIDRILNNYNCPKIIDYISLDIEGSEYKFLSKFPFSEYEFILMTVEHNLYLGNHENKEKIKKILYDNGYVISKENVKDNGFEFEDWYINKKFV
jgi:FkbM family methyltransferase